MSFSADEMNLMGSTNNLWGVCGFTSTFYSMYELNRGKRALLIGAGIATKVLAEIKTYLMLLKGWRWRRCRRHHRREQRADAAL
ncbi:MAG TPA: hypothetical protein VKI44_31580 [Acetobacteraceae bacterium]|nr:hypothetical protein [Acetobacteraceae bacterium]